MVVVLGGLVVEEHERSRQSSVTAEIDLTPGSEPADMITVIIFDNKSSFR